MLKVWDEICIYMDNNVVRTILRQMFNKIDNLAQFGGKLLDAKYIKWKLKHWCNFWQKPGVSKLGIYSNI